MEAKKAQLKSIMEIAARLRKLGQSKADALKKAWAYYIAQRTKAVSEANYILKVTHLVYNGI